MLVASLAHATLLLALLLKVTWGRSGVPRDPRVYYITTELVCADGYPVQEHTVITDDGYILTIHRIPNGRTRVKVPRREYHYHKLHRKHHPDFDDCIRESLNATSTGTPVLFVHGILMASDGWLLQGPGYDLAYLMADRGYDVWFANIRGNFYSRRHRTMSASDPKFWDFSFHENATHDIPAIIDYILKLTRRKKVGIVGYSMGTTIFFAMASVLPEYREKILGFVGLAPVAFLKIENMKGRQLAVFSLLDRILEDLRKKKNIHELFPRSNIALTIGRSYGWKGPQLRDLLYENINLSLGYNSKMVLRSKLLLYLTHLPAGTSLKNIIHLQQNILGNTFKLYQYGNATNIEIYGTPSAPDYPLESITIPVALYFSKDDIFCDIKGIEELVGLLPNVVELHHMEKHNHGDFVWSYSAKDSLFQKVFSVFRKFQDQYDLPGVRRGDEVN